MGTKRLEADFCGEPYAPFGRSKKSSTVRVVAFSKLPNSAGRGTHSLGQLVKLQPVCRAILNSARC